MAATPAQNRRYQAALRRVTARLKAEQPDTYRAWLAEALAGIPLDDAPAQGQPVPSMRSIPFPELVPGLAKLESEMEARDRRLESRRKTQAAKGRKGQHWTGYAWVDDET